ncbi:MAG: HEPN domain-containing protein [Bacteroidales bacterium]
MTEQERQIYVKYRIACAYTTFKAARVADSGFWDSSVNRLYYALFYAVSALLVQNHIQTKSHSSVRSQFSLLFVKTGKFEKKYGRLLSELFDWRQKGDYDNIFSYNGEVVEPLFEPVEEMISAIEDEIKARNDDKM